MSRPKKRPNQSFRAGASKNKRKRRILLPDRIFRAVAASSPTGLSLFAVKKTLRKTGYDVRRNSHRINSELKRLVSEGILVRITGVGASGSFRARRWYGCKTSGKAKRGRRTSPAKRTSGAKKNISKKPAKQRYPTKTSKKDQTLPRSLAKARGQTAKGSQVASRK
ncbi:histone H1.5-like [Tachyglossus aculeatus]|uniref:histone H1.5-like n=1 Tax=Tachyglossus aculeatus TaxID=9261 RepID=UPI0018F59CD9|nr:histone H1.5-like [Tachyglossus aculeatus]